jgi:hypothetical protein
MLQLIRALAKYGPIQIEASYKTWHVGCLVRLPAGVQESYVRSRGDRLHIVLKELEQLAKDEYKRLLEIQREPKQQEFIYGSNNKDWEEIA